MSCTLLGEQPSAKAGASKSLPVKFHLSKAFLFPHESLDPRAKSTLYNNAYTLPRLCTYTKLYYHSDSTGFASRDFLWFLLIKRGFFCDFYVKYTMYIAPILNIMGCESQFKCVTWEVYDRVGLGTSLLYSAIKYAGPTLRSFRCPCFTRLLRNDAEW